MSFDEKYHPISVKEEEDNPILHAYEAEHCEQQEPCQLQHPYRRDNKRPLWRRITRVTVTILALTMLWMAVAPFLFKCGGMMKKSHQKLPPNRKLHGGDDGGGEKPKLHYEFDEGLKSFYIKQGRLSTIPTRTTVYGKVVLASPEEHKVKRITVDFDIHVSDRSMWNDVRIEAGEDGIIFYPDVMSIARQYINFTAVVKVPHQKYQDFSVDVTQLDVEIQDTFTQPIEAASFETVSGNIRATHMGKDANVDARHLVVRSVSGDVKGKYGLWNSATFETTSGNIDVGLVSYDIKEIDAVLKTRSVSGKTTVEFENQLNPRLLKANHSSISGSVYLRYPSDFQGKLQLETTTGAIDVFGRGTKVIRKEQGIVGKLWEVIKGHGRSAASVNTVSGNIEVGVGRQQE